MVEREATAKTTYGTLPVFFGHGSPMNAIEQNQYTQVWREFGLSRPKPRAVLAISAHWYTNATMVTAMQSPRTIHDFYGFPTELFEVEYPVKGDPETALKVIEHARPTVVDPDMTSWGIDHGTWSVLRHVFPLADVPVLQLSIDATKAMSHHFEQGRRLAPLAEEDVLVVCSGNVVHNLRRIDFSLPGEGFDWAHKFNEAALGIMTTDLLKVVDLSKHHDFALAAPTPEHFLPLVYLAGMLYEIGLNATPIIDGYEYGSLSMTAFSAGT